MVAKIFNFLYFRSSSIGEVLVLADLSLWIKQGGQYAGVIRFRFAWLVWLRPCQSLPKVILSMNFTVSLKISVPTINSFS